MKACEMRRGCGCVSASLPDPDVAPLRLLWRVGAWKSYEVARGRKESFTLLLCDQNDLAFFTPNGKWLDEDCFWGGCSRAYADDLITLNIKVVDREKSRDA